jgi:two-component system phosphate regulon sensor histidine kinase PhoR
MKKVYTLIILLITLTLIGIIFIQVSWIKNAIVIRDEQLTRNVQMAMNEVAQELVDQKSRIPSMPKLMPDLQSEKLMQIMRAPTIVQRYSSFEIHEKLQKSFERQGLKETKFEFAVTSTQNIFTTEMQSEHFAQLVDDTVTNRLFIMPLIPQTGTIAEGLAPEEMMFVIVPRVKDFVYRSLGWMILGALVFTLVIVTAFYLTTRTMLKQKKLSEIKSDFINNMTHEFKTPLATISLAVDAMRNEKVLTDKEKLNYFSGIIKEENKRMNQQVETILQAALLEKQELQLNLHPQHVHEVLNRVLDNFALQLEEKNATVELKLNAKLDGVEADEIHFYNVFNNLIDNAIKYSGDHLVLKVSTQNISRNIRVRIEDNGIGMSKETVNRIFERFYRAHTGNLHNVKGFGLGLSYVKTVVDAHRGKVKVESSVGRGSVFTLDFPLCKVEEQREKPKDAEEKIEETSDLTRSPVLKKV